MRTPGILRPGIIGFGVLVLMAVTALTSCSDDPSDTPPDPAKLIGKTYLSESVDGPQIPGGGPLILGFAQNEVDGSTNLSANAGCNGHGGTVTFDGDTMTTGNLLGTMMACPPPREHTDQWVAKLFGAPLTWKLDGTTLTLSRDNQKVTLVEREDRPVIGTRWQVTALVSKQSVTRSDVLDERKPYFTIASDGQLTGTTGCNSMRGTAKVSPGQIEFSPIATTRMACDPEATQIEQTILAAMTGTATVTVDGKDMKLTNVADPSVGLRLTAQD